MTSTQAVTFTQTDWDEYAKCYDVLLELTPYQKLVREIVDNLHPEKDDKILDAGCGTGNLLQALHQECPLSSLQGVDLSPSMLLRAKYKFQGEKCVSFKRASLDLKLPFKSAAFSKVASVNVLYAVPNPLRTLKELKRVICRGGTLVLATPLSGYDNGLILKEHAGSTLLDEYWINPHTSPEREEHLIKEAVQNEELANAMLLIAKHNRQIARNATFHFFTQEELVSVVKESGFTVVKIAKTYAQQALLVVAKREG